MKIIKILMTLLLWSVYAKAQSTLTMRIEDLKDAWGTNVTYVGEVINGKPNGLGMFLYPEKSPIKYTGYFVDGLPQGKGAIIYLDNTFMWGDWIQGKLNGQATTLNNIGELYVGQFVNQAREGKGTIFFKDNGFVSGNFKNDKIEGRAIYINGEGKAISDNIYHENIQQGQGYLYTLPDKKLFKGTWENGTWTGASDVVYPSFLADKRFIGTETLKWNSMGCQNKEGKLHDTAFYNDYETKEKYFGVFNNGEFSDGLLIKDDVSMTLGKRNKNGATGHTIIYNLNHNFGDGLFTDDVFMGPQNFFFEFENSMMYYGNTTRESQFTGKAWLTNSAHTIYNGNFAAATFTGNGWRLDSTGYCTGGTWKDDVLVKPSFVNGPDGKPINLSPANLNDAITALVKLYEADFEPIAGPSYRKNYFMVANKSTESFYKILPAVTRNFILTMSQSTVHTSIIIDTDPVTASAKYESLCKQLSTTNITLIPGKSPFKLITKNVMKPTKPMMEMATFTFSHPTDETFKHIKVMVIIRLEQSTDTYHVMLAIGNEDAIGGWLGLY